jgi:hypothetical protein
LIITRGAKLNAVGTAAEPIVFTSNEATGSRAPSDWGGVILLGKTTINAVGGTSAIEGIALGKIVRSMVDISRTFF